LGGGAGIIADATVGTEHILAGGGRGVPGRRTETSHVSRGGFVVVVIGRGIDVSISVADAALGL